MSKAMLVVGLVGQPAPQRDASRSFQSYAASGWYHNSAAAIVKGGLVLAASEEERLTRRKGTGKFPSNALDFCLEHAQTTWEQVDLIAFGERGGHGFLLDPEISQDRIAEVLACEFGAQSIRDKIRCVEHHRAHAYSALAPTGYSSALVYTSDGFGDGISGSVWAAEGGVLTHRLRNIEFAQSLGRFYSSVLPYFSYTYDDEYKVMGLSPYGSRERARPFFHRRYSLADDGQYALELHDKEKMFLLLREFGPPRLPGEPFAPHHADVAAGIQEAFENIVLHVLRHFRKATGLPSLCLAGGAAQNSVCNGLIRSTRMFDRIFVQPAAHDAGLAIGACFAALADAGEVTGPATQSAYLGRPVRFNPESKLEPNVQLFESMIKLRSPNSLVDDVGEQLANGAICGWVQGRSEFGPRALGNRSILADPREASTKDRINQAIKNREAFRPFAPVVAAEDAWRYFEIEEGEYFPYMTVVVPVRKGVDTLAAITHVDRTARLQMVRAADNPLLYALIRGFERYAGVPVLLNTSFNGNGEPIVDSAHDALSCFLRSDLDMLVIGESVITRRENWLAGLRSSAFTLSRNWAVKFDTQGGCSLESASGEVKALPDSLFEYSEQLVSERTIQATALSFSDIKALWMSRVIEIGNAEESQPS